jgi:hypothetical protein
MDFHINRGAKASGSTGGSKYGKMCAIPVKKAAKKGVKGGSNARVVLEKMLFSLIKRVQRLCPELSIEHRRYVGIDFLYIRPPTPAARAIFEAKVREQADKMVRGTSLFYECHFVRKATDRWVYRFRFRVPDRKSFCCGNRCPDCILLRPKG